MKKVKSVSDKYYLNLGCGDRFIPSWNNIDFYSSRHNKVLFLINFLGSLNLIEKGTIQNKQKNRFVENYNLIKGIPYFDNSFDFVYNSHFLEHLEKGKANFFLSECLRVLKPNGILRIVVPDLKVLALEYLTSFNNLSLNLISFKEHENTIINLIDQMVRTVPGGIKMERQSNNNLQNEKIINYIKRILFGKYNINRTGELHKWMYDRFSLTKSLELVGFKNVTIKDMNSSFLLDWPKYNLDINEDGTPYKQESLYIEAMK